MRRLLVVCIALIVCTTSLFSQQRNRQYIVNREPLTAASYVQLPLGSIAARGWLYEQLRLSADHITGHLDEIWKDVGPTNGWLGGKGDAWERGPYWVDGLLPLAYTLHDKELIAKAQRWVEWCLKSQRPDGYFGPARDSTRVFAPEERVLAWQEKNKEDWWPHMVMLKVLEQYYDATKDKRVLDFMTNYFRYQLAHLPSTPLDHWTDWARARGGENLASIYWLYNRTGDVFLLELATMVFQQTENWTEELESGDPRYWHGVNTGMGVKQPAVYYQQSKDQRYLRAVKKGIADLMKYHGQAQGMFSGDELLHGTDPTQGTELCTVVEYMFSLETLLKITGDLDYAERLERVAFNALPAQVKPDYTGRQYYQMPNQIACDTTYQNYNTRHWGTILFGLENGYGCCTANLHQGWPKFAAHLWMATDDDGLAALTYAPSEVTAVVANGVTVKFTEETEYPFDDRVVMTYSGPKGTEFPVTLRIPAWTSQATLRINGEAADSCRAGTVVALRRVWKDGDRIELTFPMTVRLSKWHEESICVERGPLVYALRMSEQWTRVKGEGAYATYALHSPDPWNYGLLLPDVEHPAQTDFVIEKKAMMPQPFTVTDAPIVIKTKARKIIDWKQYGGITGPIPWSPIRSVEPLEEIALIPYGCSKMRISQFPFVEK